MKYNPFEHIWFKNLFDLKIMGFENVALIEVVHIYIYIYIYISVCVCVCVWSTTRMRNIHDIKSICTQNVFISRTQC
jgi:hypothetical protein